MVMSYKVAFIYISYRPVTTFFFSDSLYLKMAMWLKPLKIASLKFYMKEGQ